MYSGLSRRKEPHEERKYQAGQAIEQDYGPVSATTPVGTRAVHVVLWTLKRSGH
jgi:hypothetical protein